MSAVVCSAAFRQRRTERAFSTGSFQIFGGIDGGSSDVTAAQRSRGEVPEEFRSRVVDFSSALPRGLDPGEDGRAAALLHTG